MAAEVRGVGVLDTALALVSAASWAHAVFIDPVGVGGPSWVRGALLLISVGVLVRRRWPLPAVLLVWLPAVVQAVASSDAYEGAVIFVPAVLVWFALGRYADRRQIVVGLAAGVAGGLVHDYFDRAMHPFTWDKAVGSGFFWLVGLAALLLGAWVGERARERQSAARAAVAEEEMRRVVAEERARIARELHDVIAHDVNVVVLHAVAAQGLLDPAADRVRPPLEAIERSARNALAELRRLLGLLRDDEPDAQLVPQPSLDQLEALVADVRDAGLDVDLSMRGDRSTVPGGVELAAYRIVQEALTNTLKHAGPASVSVSVHCAGDTVCVDVADDGHGPADPVPAGSGRGLVGMRERVSMYGGSLLAGPGGNGGFRVHAELPVQRGRS